MRPYYEQGGIQIFLGDCRELLPSLWFGVNLLMADPPYGVGEVTNRKQKGRSGLAECNDFPPVYGDDEPFDPRPLLLFPRAVIWGANHFAHRLPPSPTWIVWDKREGVLVNDNADFEMAWTNLGGPARVFRHLWAGMLKASERDTRRVHPTQKPVSLMTWILEQWTEPGDLVLVPYLGSGPELQAAQQLGRRAIGIEIEERYCEIAARRLSQQVLPLAESIPAAEVRQMELAGLA